MPLVCNHVKQTSTLLMISFLMFLFHDVLLSPGGVSFRRDSSTIVAALPTASPSRVHHSHFAPAFGSCFARLDGRAVTCTLGWCERMTWGHSQLMREADPTNKGYRFTPAMCSIPHLARIYEHESSREKDFTQIVERHAKVENIWCTVLRSYCTNTRAGFSLWACTSNCLIKA